MNTTASPTVASGVDVIANAAAVKGEAFANLLRNMVTSSATAVLLGKLMHCASADNAEVAKMLVSNIVTNLGCMGAVMQISLGIDDANALEARALSDDIVKAVMKEVNAS